MPKLAEREGLCLSHNREAIRAARAFVRKAFEGLGMPEKADDGEIIASELVSNVLRYVRPSDFYIEVKRHGSRALIRVWDSSPTPPIIKMPTEYDETGRGLQIVIQLSDQLIYDPIPEECGGGKVVAALL